MLKVGYCAGDKRQEITFRTCLPRFCRASRHAGVKRKKNTPADQTNKRIWGFCINVGALFSPSSPRKRGRELGFFHFNRRRRCLLHSRQKLFLYVFGGFVEGIGKLLEILFIEEDFVLLVFLFPYAFALCVCDIE